LSGGVAVTIRSGGVRYVGTAGDGKVSEAVNLEMPVEELDFGVRTANCLKNANIRTLGQLAGKSETEILETRNFGRKSLDEMRDVLASFGLCFSKECSDGADPLRMMAALQRRINRLKRRHNKLNEDLRKVTAGIQKLVREMGDTAAKYDATFQMPNRDENEEALSLADFDDEQ
jgi:hypothetical protein